jgi:hypothetical protein
MFSDTTAWNSCADVVEEDKHLLLHMEQLIIILKKAVLKKVDRVMITTGIPVGIPNRTNIIQVEEAP